MEINDKLQAVLAGPLNCFLQVGELTLDVWFTRADVERPVADGESDVI